MTTNVPPMNDRTPTDPRTTTIEAARKQAALLKVSFVDAKPEDFDFSTLNADGEAGWDHIEAVECSDCGQWIVDEADHGYVDQDGDPAGDIPFEDAGGTDITDSDTDVLDEWAAENGYEACPRHGEGYREFDSAEGPMMNYRYPVGEHDYTTAHAHGIADLPLCLVETEDGDVYLALTGGGMDLSWQICDAYIRLGYLPPSHFELPEMGDMRLTEHTALIVAAVERSNEVLANWAQYRQTRAKRLFETLPTRSDV